MMRDSATIYFYNITSSTKILYIFEGNSPKNFTIESSTIKNVESNQDLAKATFFFYKNLEKFEISNCVFENINTTSIIM